jgi:hypothetical protein
MPQLWPELAGLDGLDPWHYLLTASSRDPEWPRVLELYAQAGTAQEPGGAPE